jgi:LysR family transcriptional regulator, nitrogen assimilation regulatory protein
MNLRRFQYFAAVSDLQSVSRAANRLRIAQPALTRHIQTLQRELGVQLFERRGRGISLTKAGELFQQRVKAVLRDLDRARIEVAALARSTAGPVEVGLPEAISFSLSHVLLKRIHENLPEIAIRIIDGWTGFIIEWLIVGRLDLGIIYDHTLTSDVLYTEPLASEEHFLICARGHELAKCRSVSALDLARVPLALPPRHNGLRVTVENHLKTVGEKPKIVYEVDSLIAIKQLVQTGQACTIMPLGNVAHDVELGRLVMVPLANSALHRTLFIAWSNERLVTPQMKAVLDVIRSEVATLVTSGRWGSRYLGRRLSAAEHPA